MTPRYLLFVCVENSCRSQMAEGFARVLGGDGVIAHSAGSHPSGQVNPRARQFMAERNIDLGGQASGGLEDLPAVDWDWIVTMGCGDACPRLSARNRADWELRDPQGLPDEAFRAVRDEIERRVSRLLDEIA